MDDRYWKNSEYRRPARFPIVVADRGSLQNGQKSGRHRRHRLGPSEYCPKTESCCWPVRPPLSRIQKQPGIFKRRTGQDYHCAASISTERFAITFDIANRRERGYSPFITHGLRPNHKRALHCRSSNAGVKGDDNGVEHGAYIAAVDTVAAVAARWPII